MTISAKIIADSISPAGVRITTFELEYPRFIHAEFMTHRMFSRNAASSRAIPVNRAIELIRENTAMPIHWGKNQPGMTAKEECNERINAEVDATPFGAIVENWSREQTWNVARDNAIAIARLFNDAGYHKQIVNRLLEPFTHIKVVLTATEYENFWWLRDHKDAQPEIAELARVMREEYNKSLPVEMCQGEWHVPYYRSGMWSSIGSDFDESPRVDIDGKTLQEAIAISASCCAQVSYRKLDDSLEKAEDIYRRLVESEPVHASPFEHQATPIHEPYFRSDEQVLLHCEPDNETLDSKGITHFDRRGWAWSGNFRGWIQNRQLIPNNVKRG